MRLNLLPAPKLGPIQSPCIGVCTMDASGLCEGCARTLDEIACWSSYDDERRRLLMDDVLPTRELSRG